MLKSLFVFLITVFLNGCGVEINGSASAFFASGSMYDSYVEEPINARYRKYEPALQLSNKLVVMIKQGDYAIVYNEYFSDEMKASLDQQGFGRMLENIFSNVGQIDEFKPMQWYFQVYEKDGRALLASTKIVKHGSLLINYAFVFDQGKYDKIVGLKFSNHKPLKSKTE